jgi:hypothetical protein
VDPADVLRAYPEWSSLEFINLLEYHLTMEDLLQHSTDTMDVAFDLNKARTDCRARFSRAYFACYQYAIGIVVDKNWTSMQKELKAYLLAHKTLNETGEVTYAQVMMRYLIHPSKLQTSPRPLVIKDVIYDELKKVTYRMGQLLVQLIAHEFRTFSNAQAPLPITHRETGKNTSLHFSDHGSPPVHYSVTNYGQTIPYTVNDTYQGFKLPYKFKNNTEAPFSLRTVLHSVWKNVLIMSYESYESLSGVSVATGKDEITGDLFCAISMASASSVLCSRMDKDNIIYVREYCYAGDDKNETLTPSNTNEQTFLKDTMHPITINQVDAKHTDYIVLANGSNHLSVCEVAQQRAFEVHITDEAITFENMIDSRGVYSSAKPPPRPAFTSSDPLGNEMVPYKPVRIVVPPFVPHSIFTKYPPPLYKPEPVTSTELVPYEPPPLLVPTPSPHSILTITPPPLSTNTTLPDMPPPPTKPSSLVPYEPPPLIIPPSTPHSIFTKYPPPLYQKKPTTSTEMVPYEHPPLLVSTPSAPHSILTQSPPPLYDPKIPPIKKRSREAPPTTLQIAHTLLVLNSSLLERCPLEIVEVDELVTQLSKLVLPTEPMTEVYQLCGHGATVEYYCGTDGKTRCFITDQDTIKIVEISDKDTEKQYPGLIMPRAENTLAIGAGLGTAAYLSVLLINRASIVPKMTMLVIGFLQSAMSAFDFADGLVGASTEFLTDTVIRDTAFLTNVLVQGGQKTVAGTGLVLLSSAQLLASMAGGVGNGLVTVGETLWPSHSVINKALPVVIATVQVTKDTVTGVYTVFSFKNAIATVILSSIENRLFGTQIIRNAAIDTGYAVGNTFIDITGLRRVPQRIGELATQGADRAAETAARAAKVIADAQNNMTNTGVGAAGLVLVLAGAALMISAD